MRWLAEQRADAVKLWVDDRLGLAEPMTPANYRAVIDEAHRHNLRVIAHVWYLEDAKDLVRAGVDGLAHPIRDKDVDDEMIELLKSHPNVFIQTTLRPDVHVYPDGRPCVVRGPSVRRYKYARRDPGHS